MNPTWVITKRELGAYFGSLVAYILLVLFLVLCGLFTWLLGGDIFFNQQVSLTVFFSVAQWVFLIFIPALTMRQFAEEKRTGTIELLLTKNVSNRQIVWGKFLSCVAVVGIALLLTLPYYISVAQLGNIDHGSTLTGYLGLFLLSASYISIGLFASSLTNNQIVAFLTAFFLCALFAFLFSFVGNFFTGFLGDVIKMFSLTDHFGNMSRGVVDTKDLIYFFTIILMGLFLTEWRIAQR